MDLKQGTWGKPSAAGQAERSRGGIGDRIHTVRIVIKFGNGGGNVQGDTVTGGRCSARSYLRRGHRTPGHGPPGDHSDKCCPSAHP